MTRVLNNNRGVALLISLLVTALLIALIFEFAYGSRISLRASMNFRDSQRAYFLARSGVNFAGEILYDNYKKNKKQENLEQKEWLVVPVVTGEDAELKVRWEDEGGKLNIKSVTDANTLGWLDNLFENKEIGADVLDKIKERRTFNLPTELHQVMSDEQFGRIERFVTVFTGQFINVNTASEEVLKSLGVDSSRIISMRSESPISDRNAVFTIVGDAKAPDQRVFIKNFLDVTSDVFKVHSFATVGEYTRQVEAVIQRSSSGFSILYWRAL